MIPPLFNIFLSNVTGDWDGLSVNATSSLVSTSILFSNVDAMLDDALKVSSIDSLTGFDLLLSEIASYSDDGLDLSLDGFSVFVFNSSHSNYYSDDDFVFMRSCIILYMVLVYE